MYIEIKCLYILLPRILSHSHKHLSRSWNQKKKKRKSPVCLQAKHPPLCPISCSSRTTSGAKSAFRTLMTCQSVLLSDCRWLFIFVLGNWCINTDPWGTVALSENGVSSVFALKQCKCSPSLKSRSLATDQLTLLLLPLNLKCALPKKKTKKTVASLALRDCTFDSC